MTPDTERPQIGLSMPRPDARDKVTGRTVYAIDAFPDGLVWAGVKRADVPHARLITVDTDAAARTPGVVRVLTHQDVPGPNRQGIVHQDQPILATDTIRSVTDAVALVLAETRESLRRALGLIRVDSEPLPAVFDPEEALADGAPLVHEDHGSNLMAEVILNKGNADEGLGRAEVVVEGSFQVPRQEHAYLETEGGWAVETPDGRVEITVGTQSPYRDRREIAAALGLPVERIRVITPFMGGGFGGKDGASVQSLLALAALNASGRPVKMVWDREESFLASVKRVPARLEYRVGLGSDGTLHALICRLVMDGGPYDHLGGEVLSAAVEHAGGAYRIPHVRVEGRIAYTNNPLSGPFRGFGVPQATAAVEQMMDLCAERLGMDPLTLRLKNVLRRGDRTPAGVTLIYSTGAEACLRKLASHPFWTERSDWKAGAAPHKRRGVGVACLSHGSSYGPLVPDYATARVVLGLDGRFQVDASVVDMGQGNAATYLQMAGDILNQRVDDLSPVLPDTDRTLPACSSAASRTTYTYGNALITAAGRLKERILDHAALMLMAGSGNEFELVPRAVRHLPSGRDIPLDQVAATMPSESRVSTHYWRAPVARDRVDVKLTSAIGIPHIVFSFAAHLVRVEIDDLTGRVDVLDYLAATDAGRVLNPQLYEQQVQGGVVQGLGYALSEDYMVKEGRGLTPNLATYIIPTAMDAPDMISVPVETVEPTGPYGQKGVGEIPINGPLPAVANAVADACGVRTVEAPLTPERILAALSAARRS